MRLTCPRCGAQYEIAESAIPVAGRVAVGAGRFLFAAILRRRRPVLFRRAVEKRIALELRFDIGDKIEIRELEQLDRLHQLRCHHQQLALTEL